MIIGYIKLKDCKAGQLVRLRDGTYIVTTEYRTFNSGAGLTQDSYLLESGECFHAGKERANDWVAIIDMNYIEVNVAHDADYPPDPNAPMAAEEYRETK